MAGAVFEVADLRLLRASGRSAFELRVPRLAIARGEKVALVGPSGCGKSTLLDALSMILMPAGVGRFRFRPAGDADLDIGALLMRRAANRLAAVRRRWIGYVLQTGGLLPFLTVRANIALSRKLLGLPSDGTVESLAETLGIAEHLRKKPAALSVGERQRVAIARALAHRPAIVIADEPTAALDPANAAKAMQLFVDLADRFGTTTIVASHDHARVTAFGLRPLAQRFVGGAAAGTTVSVFEG